MTIKKNYQGAYVISEIVNGYRVQHTFMGYTKKQAVSLFKKLIDKE